MVFYCRATCGVRESDGDERQTIRKKAKYRNPVDNFGQPANGGLTNVDQRQLKSS